MSNPSLDAGIPVLTEVIPLSQEEPESRPHKASEPTARGSESSEPRMPVPAPTLLERAALEWDDDKWDLMEREIRERVLYQVMEQINEALEQRVRDSLADVLQTAVEGLATELKGGLRHTIQDVVTRAVALEISKLQSSKN
jgi:hypothetical protein